MEIVTYVAWQNCNFGLIDLELFETDNAATMLFEFFWIVVSGHTTKTLNSLFLGVKVDISTAPPMSSVSRNLYDTPDL